MQSKDVILNYLQSLLRKGTIKDFLSEIFTFVNENSSSYKHLDIIRKMYEENERNQKRGLNIQGDYNVRLNQINVSLCQLFYEISDDIIVEKNLFDENKAFDVLKINLENLAKTNAARCLFRLNQFISENSEYINEIKKLKETYENIDKDLTKGILPIDEWRIRYNRIELKLLTVIGFLNKIDFKNEFLLPFEKSLISKNNSSDKFEKGIVQKNISNNDINKAFDYIEEYFKENDSDYKNDLLLLKQRWVSKERKNNIGIESECQFNVESNNIVYAILNLIQKISEENE